MATVNDKKTVDRLELHDWMGTWNLHARSSKLLSVKCKVSAQGRQ